MKNFQSADERLVYSLGGSSADALAVRAREIADELEGDRSPWPGVARESMEVVTGRDYRLVTVSSSAAELGAQLSAAARFLDSGKGKRMLPGKGVFVNGPTDEPGLLAMLFPGQGAQYVGMLAELAFGFDEVRSCLDEADEVMLPLLERPLSNLIFGRGVEREEAEQELIQTRVTQPAMLACDIAVLRLLKSHGVRPDVVAGHSLGEYAAAVAAKVMSFPDAMRTVAARAREMTSATPSDGDAGKMAALRASFEQVEELLNQVDGYVVAANKNCPIQTIVAGASGAVDQFMALADERGIVTKQLPVSHAFHSAIVEPACRPLAAFLRQIELQPPKIPVLANVTGREYPTGSGFDEEIVDLLSRQVASPVEFIAEIERMYEIGVRTFVEVGPGRTLSTFVSKTLGKRPHQIFATINPQKGEARSFLETLAGLIASGRDLEPLRISGGWAPVTV